MKMKRCENADDTQLYVELRDATDSALQTCFSLLRTWFTTNGLSLNAEKSEAIISALDRIPLLLVSTLTSET